MLGCPTTYIGRDTGHDTGHDTDEVSSLVHWQVESKHEAMWLASGFWMSLTLWLASQPGMTTMWQTDFTSQLCGLVA